MAQQHRHFELSLTEALEAQQLAMGELTDLVDRQGALISGLTIALGAFVDLIPDAMLREQMEMHLRVALEREMPEVTSAIIEVIFHP